VPGTGGLTGGSEIRCTSLLPVTGARASPTSDKGEQAAHELNYRVVSALRRSAGVYSCVPVPARPGVWLLVPEGLLLMLAGSIVASPQPHQTDDAREAAPCNRATRCFVIL